MSTSHAVWGGDIFSFLKYCLWDSKKFAVDFVAAVLPLLKNKNMGGGGCNCDLAPPIFNRLRGPCICGRLTHVLCLPLLISLEEI